MNFIGARPLEIAKKKLTRYSVSSLPKGGSTKFKIQRGPRGMLSEVHKYVNRTSTKWRPTSIVVASFHAYLPQCQASMSKDCLSLGVKKLQHSDNSKIWIKTSSFATGTLTRGWQHKYFAGFPACYFIPILAISFITSVWIHLACIHCLHANVPLEQEFSLSHIWCHHAAGWCPQIRTMALREG